MKRKKVYIAGPMSGYPEFNYPAFREAETALIEKGYHAISPVRAGDLNSDGTALYDHAWYLRRDLRLLLDAEGIAMLPGWENSQGAVLEHTVAVALKLDIREYAQW